jgi:hypothetical protein
VSKSHENRIVRHEEVLWHKCLSPHFRRSHKQRFQGIHAIESRVRISHTQTPPMLHTVLCLVHYQRHHWH